MTDHPTRTAVVCATAAAVAGAVRAGLGRRRRPAWERTNHAGRAVDLYAGPAVAAGTVLAALGAASARERGAAVLATLAGAACGAYDDVRGDHRRGFRAHLGALRHGEVTGGAVKLFGIGAAGLAAGALLRDRPLDGLLAGVVVAGTAHFVNLVDVRPGRAALAVLVLGAPGAARGGLLAAAPVGAAAAVLRDDLGERTMLGDTGAHALGAALGAAVAAGAGRFGLALGAAAAVAAAVGGEGVSRLARSPV
ncbi:hypothetical protein LUW75_20065 [Streptomyces sp. MRC013]|uniref:hypothetical protein n=1 Tax=Streptomyces sp. MRC013 TaxID=2898276 RepID=UPI002026877B|nr:hypothetical protein [Streptomyces sp. MRC013]URM91884.1 hypothetical protein LUW75_20065 [Streptomyces sp. MRC013]